MMDIFYTQAFDSLTMALQNSLSDWRSHALKKSGCIEKFVIVLAAEAGYALTCLIGVVETVVRFALSFPLGIFGFLMDKANYDKAVAVTIHGSIVSLKSTIHGFISLFTNLTEHNRQPLTPQISDYVPAIHAWINSFFSTPQELWRRQSAKTLTIQPCCSYDFLTFTHMSTAGSLPSNKPLLKNLFELIGTIFVVFLSVVEFLLAAPSDSVKSLFNQTIDYTYTKATILTWYLALGILYEKSIRFDRVFIDIQKEYLAS